MTKDPVCGTALEEIDTAVLTCYGGQLLAFCSHRCLMKFSDDPDAYIEKKEIAKAS